MKDQSSKEKEKNIFEMNDQEIIQNTIMNVGIGEILSGIDDWNIRYIIVKMFTQNQRLADIVTKLDERLSNVEKHIESTDGSDDIGIDEDDVVEEFEMET